MKRQICLLAALFAALGFLRPAAAQPQRYSMSFFDTFDTVITIQGFADSRETFDRVTGEARLRFSRLHRIFDAYHEYEGLNNLYILNRDAALHPVQVPEDLFDLIDYCRRMQPQLNNTVNIAMGAVLALWHEARERAEYNPGAASLPEPAALAEAARHTRMEDVLLDPENRTVAYGDPRLRLDLGAVAKGYAAEQVARFMLDSDMPSFIINAGGNIRTGLPPLDGRNAWAVAVQDPDGFAFSDAGSDILETLYVSNLSVVTSGDYQRFFVVDGVKYHHIISPATLMPSAHMRSVTVVTEDSGYADLLSTALFLMSWEEGMAWLKSLEGVDALWVLQDRSVRMTEGLSLRAKSQGASPR